MTISAGFSTARIVDLSTGQEQALPSISQAVAFVASTDVYNSAESVADTTVPLFEWTWHYMNRRDWKRLVRFFGLTTHSRKVMHRMARREARHRR